MFSAGLAAQRLNWLEGCTQVYAIPVSASSKNPFFDRKPKEEMIAVGDGFNDLSMIQYAGLGVAMANAQEIVRQNADYITLSNEEDGVAAVVEKFIL